MKVKVTLHREYEVEVPDGMEINEDTIQCALDGYFSQHELMSFNEFWQNLKWKVI